MDYYNILGVPKEASQDDIKKAYRKLAMTHHPDRGGDLATFQRINEAYDTLGDVDKRAKYDQPSGQFPNDFSFDGNFNNMFGEMFNNIFRQNANQRAQSLYRTQLSISLIDAYHGKEQIIQLRVKNDLRTLNIKIPRGIESGYSVKYDLLDNTTLIIDFIIMDDTRFQRRGKDLYSTVNVSVLDLIGGGKLKFATISGEILDVSIPSKTQPTSKIKLSGQGMHLQNGTVGDQYLLIQTFIPDNITDELIEYIKDYNKKDNT